MLPLTANIGLGFSDLAGLSSHIPKLRLQCAQLRAQQPEAGGRDSKRLKLQPENSSMRIDTSLMFAPEVVAEMAGEMEAAGFDGAYAFEGQNDPFVALAAAAMKTERLELMTSIAVAFARNPMNLAYLANDLQCLSKGRFILGLGTQVKAHIERRFSMPWSRPASRMKEMVLAIKEIWSCWETGEKLKFEGDFYNHTLMSPTFAPKLSEHGMPKIYLAAVGPKMTEVAGEVAEGYFVHPFHTSQSLEQLSLPAIDRGLQKAGKGRDGFEISAQVIVATGLTEEAMEAAIFSARNQIAFYASTPAYRPVLEVHGWEDMQPELTAMTKAGDWQGLSNMVNDEILHTFALVGTPEEVGAKMNARLGGIVERVSPVIYQPDAELLTALLQAVRSHA